MKYIWVTHESKSKLEHVVIAEAALGHALPIGAEVHHVDGDGHNNNPSNLVICPSRNYHKLLHQRTRAFDACGNADWLKCKHCGNWDDPSLMKTWLPKGAHLLRAHHVECNRKYQRNRKANGFQNSSSRV